MRRLGRRARSPWKSSDWFKEWQQRGPQAPTPEQLIRRNEIERFRLVLAHKEPKS